MVICDMTLNTVGEMKNVLASMVDLRSSEVPGTIPLDKLHGHIFHEHHNRHIRNVSLNNITCLFYIKYI